MTFDIYGGGLRETDIDDEAGLESYLDSLLDLFAESPEGQARLAIDPEMGFWVARFIDYGYIYTEVLPPEFGEAEVDELLFEVFPRKISITSTDELADVLPELVTFWEYLKRAYELPNADEVLAYLRTVDFDEFSEEMINPSNFGMAKSFVTAGQAAGFDMSDQESMNEFMRIQQASAILDLRTPALSDLGEAPGQRRLSSPSKNKRKMVKASRKQNRRKKKKK